MDIQKPTLPSERLQAVLSLFEKSLREGVLKDKSLPEWYYMASALMAAFEVFDKSGKTDLMFDTSNPFDMAMLTWCVETTVREKRKIAVTPTIDLSRN